MIEAVIAVGVIGVALWWADRLAQRTPLDDGGP